MNQLLSGNHRRVKADYPTGLGWFNQVGRATCGLFFACRVTLSYLKYASIENRTTPSVGSGMARVFAGHLFAGQPLDIKVLSSRPDMVSGGSALVELSGPSPDGIRVMLNGRGVGWALACGGLQPD
jgi:hypothetical protein